MSAYYCKGDDGACACAVYCVIAAHTAYCSQASPLWTAMVDQTTRGHQANVAVDTH